MNKNIVVHKKISILTSIVLFGLGSFSANAAVIDLFELAVNIDGVVSSIGGSGSSGDPVPGTVDLTGFDGTTGLGQIDITITGAGLHNALVFMDHEIDEAINTFFNESASTDGTPAGGQSWEADEPGFLFGDIFDNVLVNTLDNTNGVPAGSEDDVSMALGWDFSLAAGETALASFFTRTTNNIGSFFIEQFDPDSVASIFFWSTLDITGDTEPPEPPIAMPEPGTLGLALFGILSVFGLQRRRVR